MPQSDVLKVVKPSSAKAPPWDHLPTCARGLSWEMWGRSVLSTRPKTSTLDVAQPSRTSATPGKPTLAKTLISVVAISPQTMTASINTAPSFDQKFVPAHIQYSRERQTSGQAPTPAPVLS